MQQLLRFYQFDTAEQFFDEMSNCLEIKVDANNYEQHLNEFQNSYNAWLESHT